jgi:hypothetical protein
LLLLALGVGLGLMLQQQLEAQDREELDGKTELVEFLFADLNTNDRIINRRRADDMAIGHPHLQIGLRSERGWLVNPTRFARDYRIAKTSADSAPGVSTVLMNDGHWWLRDRAPGAAAAVTPLPTSPPC